MKSTIWICLLFALTACSFRQVEPPVGCEESVIYKELAGGREVCSIITIAHAVALTEDAYKAQDALEVVESLERMLDVYGGLPTSVTYSQFIAEAIRHVRGLNQKYKALLMIITQEVEYAFQLEIPINQCDRDLIRGCLKRVKATL